MPQDRDEQLHSKVAVAIATIAVSTASILIRFSESGPLTIAFYRLFFNTLILLPWLLVSFRGELQRLKRADWIRLAAIGLILACHFAFWITSINMTTVANSVVLVSTHPLMVAAISAFFLKETPSKISLAGGFITIIGVLLMFISDISMEGLTGDLFALIGALCAGFYIVGGRSERRQLSTVTYCSVVYGFCALFLAPLAFFESGLIPSAPRDWYLFLAMAIVPGILGHTLYNYALGKVPAFFVSTTLIGEPVLASMMAWLLLSEKPAGLTLIGAPIVLAGILLAAYSPKKC